MTEANRVGGEYEVNGVMVDANGEPIKGKAVSVAEAPATEEAPAARKSGAKRK